MVTATVPAALTSVSTASAAPIVAPYYAGWSQPSLPPSALPWQSMTHVIHFSLLPTANGGLSEANGISAANSQAIVDEAHRRGRKVLIAVGGTPGSEHFASAASPANRAVFVRNLVALVNARGYDGIDLDWETGVNHGDYVALVKDLRAALGTKLLSAVYLGSWSALARDTHAYLDWVSMMTYLPYGQPSNAHNSAIYGSLYARIDNLVNLWTGSGVPVAKILPGLATYASVWSGGSLVTAEMPYATAKARGYTAGQAWDATALTSYWSSGGTWVSIENDRSVKAKADYIRAKGVGGLVVWELGAGRDGSSIPLMTSVGTHLLGTPSAEAPPAAMPVASPIKVGDRVRVTAGRFTSNTGTVSWVGSAYASVRFWFGTRSVLVRDLVKI
jgi:chitinase